MALPASEEAGAFGLALAAGVAAAASAVLTWLAMHYARRRGLIDHPGARRSHREATPRGGGIGIVVLALVALSWLLWTEPAQRFLGATFAFGVAGIAAIGWLDDHSPQPVLRRLCVHIVAAVALVFALLPGAPWEWLVAATLLLVTAVNFCNFMDGINGLAASQAALVCFILSWAFGRIGDGAWASLAAVVGAACVGFLPFNVPRARVFLGDVASGALGFAVGALLLLAVLHKALPLAGALLLPSAFVLDAGLTLAQRMLRGRRWYAAHREHLYQWLVRSGRSHLEVSLMYLAWTAVAAGLAIAAPLESQPALTVATYAAGAGFWWTMRRRLLLQRRRSR